MSRSWLLQFMPRRLQIAWLYRRGMLRAKLGQHASALEDYREVIEHELVDVTQLATALYNRALVYDAQGQRSAAIEDLRRLLQLGGAPERVRTEARRRLLRMDQRLARSEAESTNADG